MTSIDRYKKERYVPAEGGFARPIALDPCVVETTDLDGVVIGTRVAHRVFVVENFLSTWVHMFTESRLVELKIDSLPKRTASGDIIFTSGANTYAVREPRDTDPADVQNYVKYARSLEERLEQEN